MIISIIVAYDNKRGIGKDNQIPWHLSSDLKRFKRLTMGHHVIMGRKTWQSIGKGLAGRKMMIISHSHGFEVRDCEVVPSIEKALNTALLDGDDEAFIIGGGEIYTHSINQAECLYITEVLTESDADVFFPKLDPRDWYVIFSRSYPCSAKDQFSSRFKILVRKKAEYVEKMIARIDEVILPKLAD